MSLLLFCGLGVSIAVVSGDESAKATSFREARTAEIEAKFRDRTRPDSNKLAWKEIALLDDVNVRTELRITPDELPTVALACEMLIERDREYRVAVNQLTVNTGPMRLQRRVEDRIVLEAAIGKERWQRLRQIKWRFDGPLRSIVDPDVMAALELRGKELSTGLAVASDAAVKWLEASKGRPFDSAVPFWAAQTEAFDQWLGPARLAKWTALLGAPVTFGKPKNWPGEIKAPYPANYLETVDLKLREMPRSHAFELLRKGPMPWQLAWHWTALLSNENVRKELKVTVDQLDRIEKACAVLKKSDEDRLTKFTTKAPMESEAERREKDSELLEQTLGKRGLQRLRQLRCQLDGPRRACADAAVASAVFGADDCRAVLMRAMVKVGKQQDAGNDPLTRLRARAVLLDEAFEAEMSPEQKKKWAELIGPKVSFPAPEGWKDGLQMPTFAMPSLPDAAKAKG